MSFDIYRLKKECDYFCNYYGQEFVEGLGTEDILKFFDKYFVEGDWLDLGGGSSSLLWWLAQKYYNKIDIIDISQEAFFVADLIKQSDFNKGCFQFVRKHYYNKNLCKCDMNFIVKDFFKDEFDTYNKYRNISQIGLLGLCKNKKMFFSNLTKIIKLLAPQGVVINANWLFNDVYSKKKGLDNSYINQGLIYEFANENGLKVLECKFVEFNDDINYKGVLIYVLQK